MRDDESMFIDERVRRCRYCGEEMTTSALAYEENPYCAKCLAERTRDTAVGDVSWREIEGYLEFVRKAP